MNQTQLTDEEKKVAPVNQFALSIVRGHDYGKWQHNMIDWMTSAGQDCPQYPTLASEEVRGLRGRLIYEELDELMTAYRENDLVEVADALTDLLYVVLGSFVAHGLNANAFFTAVHSNNVSKIANGHRDEGGKWIKPVDHLPPDLYSLLVAQWRASPIIAGIADRTCPDCEKTNQYHEYEHIGTLSGGYSLIKLCNGVRIKT